MLPAVHPRACGERPFVAGLAKGYNGSSPRVRGTGASRRHARAAGRFIPARAGNGLDVMLLIICDLCAAAFSTGRLVAVGKN